LEGPGDKVVGRCIMLKGQPVKKGEKKGGQGRNGTFKGFRHGYERKGKSRAIHFLVRFQKNGKGKNRSNLGEKEKKIKLKNIVGLNKRGGGGIYKIHPHDKRNNSWGMEGSR